MNNTIKGEDRLLTRAEAAEFLNIKPNTLAVWATNKRYPLSYTKIGSKVAYRRSDLEAFIIARTISHTQATLT